MTYFEALAAELSRYLELNNNVDKYDQDRFEKLADMFAHEMSRRARLAVEGKR